MLRDYSTWDVDYNAIVEEIREKLVEMATTSEGYTSVLIRGSGTFGVEATIGSVIPPDGKILIVNNGAYGKRIVEIADRLKIARVEVAFDETSMPNLDAIADALDADASITHVTMVHCETTTGMLNPAREVGQMAAEKGRCYILDAMSSFAGMDYTIDDMNASYLIASTNKCIQGVPGFAFVVANREKLQETAGWARSLSLDLYDQWREMEEHHGKWRYTSPTHVVRAFRQAIIELEEEGGIPARHQRYHQNQKRLVERMQAIGFRTLLPIEIQSPIITSFIYPDDPRFEFNEFYDRLKKRRFVIYPGKVTQAQTFRIGTIGNVFPSDIEELTDNVAAVINEMGVVMKD